MKPQSASNWLKRRLSWARGRTRELALLGVALVGAGVFISCVSVERVVMAPPSIPGAEYVGNEACSECHEPVTRKFQNAAHAFVMHPTHEDLNIGCESCHGPGSLHSESGGAHDTIINPERNPDACFQCHLDMRGRFNLPYHHPLEPGVVGCSDCHDPHEGPAIRGGGTALASANDTCLQCHTAQRGPHVFEHEAVREGCITCHSPHGSVNPKLLTERNANLCLKCHIQQQAGGVFAIGGRPHDQFLPRGTCWSGGCHEAVHGSQVSSSLRF